jgi:predicted homoserine dehydrogenase-like protein
MNHALEQAIHERLAAARPVRIGLVGAGACARMILRHLWHAVPWLQVTAVASRTLTTAAQALVEAGGLHPVAVRTEGELAAAAAAGHAACTDDAELLCRSTVVDVLVEATGTVEAAAAVALSAFQGGKHVVLVNAELDSTVGPILKACADSHGVVLTHTDGEEPAVAMSLLRYAQHIGLRPVAAGNIKGMLDRHRTPDTQREFATRHRMDPAKVTSFADGTKLAMESCLLANACGFGVGTRGMYGPHCAHVREVADRLPPEQLLGGGIVDYAVGAEPHTGAFVVVYEPDRRKAADLAYFKLGDGPFHVLYTPYHLPHAQIVSSIGRAALLHESTLAPRGAPVGEVVTIAKRSLQAGELLDGIGGFMAYGILENAAAAVSEGLLPMGLSAGCRLRRDLPQGAAIAYGDVEIPPGRLADRLRAEQAALFAAPPSGLQSPAPGAGPARTAPQHA